MVDMTQLVLTPEAAAEEAVVAPEFAASVGKSGILFGRERSGLTNEEVALADRIISIPSFPHFSSLNLAQAVNIVGFEFWKRQLEVSAKSPPSVWLHPRDGERLARREELESFFKRLEQKLDESNYQLDPVRREINYRNIRNIFQRVMLAKTEVDLLQGVLTAIIKAPVLRANESENP
jgi:tRNA/rRNA methyltransferase